VLAHDPQQIMLMSVSSRAAPYVSGRIIGARVQRRRAEGQVADAAEHFSLDLSASRRLGVETFLAGLRSVAKIGQAINPASIPDARNRRQSMDVRPRPRKTLRSICCPPLHCSYSLGARIFWFLLAWRLLVSE